MRQNPGRRTALLDAAIEVLAGEGSRGLTLRAIDAAAEVPAGTATNYFKNRADLLAQVMQRTRERLTPDETELADTMASESGHALERTLMRQLLGRMRRDRASYLAMFELRLEGTRRPELQAELHRVLGAEMDGVVGFHMDNLDAGLPGDRVGVVLLYYAMLGFILDEITIPDVTARNDEDELLEAMITRLLPENPPA